MVGGGGCYLSERERVTGGETGTKPATASLITGVTSRLEELLMMEHPLIKGV